MDFSGNGAKFRTSSFKSAVTSWQNIGLFALKPLIHWMFNLGLFQTENNSLLMNMSYLALFIVTGIAIVQGGFASYLARMSPRGCIPSAWGHLQTMADLVDDWGTADGLFWGDKGTNVDGSRMAGTSDRRDGVQPIMQGDMYS
ncbi:hypothetical protein ONS96_009928 [Cadophora gregata f. sp. sojae]|nr:hypothetical protein ONS96_009928 [Cadophora gregata f. sp. sojae]